ncbi:unnamed protein product [Symbiodinium sp. CCMP2592]|nr:unnamed protein product [Symbiodinium sp. CCMP2592]
MAPSHVCPTLNRGLQEFAKAARADVARRRRGLHHKSLGLSMRLQQQCQQLPALRLLFVCIVLWASGPIAAGQVTNVQFYDEDPAWFQLAGSISWDPPADVTGIDHYLVHPACSPDLTFEAANNPGGEPLIVHYGAGGTLQDVPVGTNSIRGVSGSNDYFFKACSGTQFQNPWAAYFVVATMTDQNVATSYGVSHCYDYRDAANGGTVPDPPPLLFGSFADTDPDAGEVGGTLTWTVDGTYNYGTYDFTMLSDYAIYLALDTGGTGGFELATVQPGSLSYTIPDNTDQQTATCLLMYGQNRLGLSATPSFSHCFEAASGSFTSTTVTSVTSTTSLTVTNTIDPTQDWSLQNSASLG